MKIWWVLGWDKYYPGVDNFVKSFSTKEEAEEWIKLERHDHSCERYDIINISERL